MRITHGFRPLGTPHAVTIGNFDGLHLGHQAMLKRLTDAARSLGLPPCVMTFEPHPREYFAPEQAPARLSNLREKLELFEKFGVERVFILRFNHRFAQVSAENFIDRILCAGLKVRWVLVGDDFRFGAKRAGDFNMLQQAGLSNNFTVQAMESVLVSGQRVSSTIVREALANGELALAERYLGRHYSISGKVVHGESLGRKIGFPTANIQMKHNKPPLSGIFAVEVYGLGDKPLQGAASLGVRPTINDKGKATLEVFLFDFDGDIYNRHLHVDFLLKLRDEMKFPNLESLTAQIAADVENAKKFFINR